MNTCIITGAGAGIGREVAIALSKNKQFKNIALLGRNCTDLRETFSKMDNKGISVELYDIDLEYQNQIPHIVADIFNKFHSIDCLLNIAGYTDPQPLLATSLESFEKTFKVNLYSPFILIRECTRYMKHKGGKILNVGSTAGITPRPGWLSYSSSKAAIISMSQTLSEELAEYNIKTYCISPGRCATKLRKRLAPNEDPTTIMQPAEVASVICLLISQDECCLDGQNIIIRKKIN